MRFYAALLLIVSLIFSSGQAYSDETGPVLLIVRGAENGDDGHLTPNGEYRARHLMKFLDPFFSGYKIAGNKTPLRYIPLREKNIQDDVFKDYFAEFPGGPFGGEWHTSTKNPYNTICLASDSSLAQTKNWEINPSCKIITDDGDNRPFLKDKNGPQYMADRIKYRFSKQHSVLLALEKKAVDDLLSKFGISISENPLAERFDRIIAVTPNANGTYSYNLYNMCFHLNDAAYPENCDNSISKDLGNLSYNLTDYSMNGLYLRKVISESESESDPTPVPDPTPIPDPIPDPTPVPPENKSGPVLLIIRHAEDASEKEVPGRKGEIFGHFEVYDKHSEGHMKNDEYVKKTDDLKPGFLFPNGMTRSKHIPDFLAPLFDGREGNYIEPQLSTDYLSEFPGGPLGGEWYTSTKNPYNTACLAVGAITTQSRKWEPIPNCTVVTNVSGHPFLKESTSALVTEIKTRLKAQKSVVLLWEHKYSLVDYILDKFKTKDKHGNDSTIGKEIGDPMVARFDRIIAITPEDISGEYYGVHLYNMCFRLNDKDMCEDTCFELDANGNCVGHAGYTCEDHRVHYKEIDDYGVCEYTNKDIAEDLRRLNLGMSGLETISDFYLKKVS